MLCLHLAPGEYMTIGSDVVVQVDGIAGNRCKLLIQAPRQVPIVRGAVLERTGGERPDCVFDTPHWYKREVPWDRSKAQALQAMRCQSPAAAAEPHVPHGSKAIPRGFKRLTSRLKYSSA